MKWNYPRIEEPTTSKTSHSRLSNTSVVKSTATNTDRMKARIVIGVQGIFLKFSKLSERITRHSGQLYVNQATLGFLIC